MKNRRVVANSLLVIVTLLAICSCSGDHAQALAAQLDNQFLTAVPQGSPRAVVIKFLKDRHIEFHEDSRKRLITAAVPDVDRGFFYRAGVYLEFKFDQQSNLQEHKIRAIATGL